VSSEHQFNLGRIQQGALKGPSAFRIFRNGVAITFSLLLIALLPALTYASSNEVAKSTLDPCANASSGAYSSMVECQQHLMKGEEKKLDEILAKLVKAVEGTEHGKTWNKKLLASQKAWLNYRDAHCSLQNMVVRDVGKQMPPMPSCLGSINSERTKELETLYKCITVGGGECPWP
jgi:uncharacterized protein YecT (DUF1311 family)